MANNKKKMCDLVGGRQIKSRHQLRVNNDLLLLITRPAGGEEKGFEWYRKMRYQDIEKGNKVSLRLLFLSTKVCSGFKP